MNKKIKFRAKRSSKIGKERLIEAARWLNEHFYGCSGMYIAYVAEEEEVVIFNLKYSDFYKLEIINELKYDYL